MKLKLITATTAFMGLLGLAGATFAQTSAVPAAPDPAKGGQASTKTPAGVANPTQRPDGSQRRLVTPTSARRAAMPCRPSGVGQHRVGTPLDVEPNPPQLSRAAGGSEVHERGG